jgi:hypothetical protein
MLSLFAVLSGLILDVVYTGFGVSASAIAGQAGEVVPYGLKLFGALVVILLSVKPLYFFFRGFLNSYGKDSGSAHEGGEPAGTFDAHKTECKTPT